jgi:ATP-dependent Zn protease
VNEAVLMATRRGAQRVAEQDILAGIERTKNGIQRKSNMSAVGRLANNPIVASFEQMIASNMDKLKDTQQTIVRGQQRMP